MNRALHNVLLAIASLAMIAVLGFLYLKTQSVDLPEQNEILGLLHELKNIDSRWDVDVLRARAEFGAESVAPIDRRAQAGKTLKRLTVASRNVSSESLTSGLPELEKAIDQKAGGVDILRQQRQHRGPPERAKAAIDRPHLGPPP